MVVSASRISHSAGVARRIVGAAIAGTGAVWLLAVVASSSASAPALSLANRPKGVLRPLNRLCTTCDPRRLRINHGDKWLTVNQHFPLLPVICDEPRNYFNIIGRV